MTGIQGRKDLLVMQVEPVNGEVMTLEVDAFGVGVRLDLFASSRTSLSRSMVQKYIASGCITVCGESVKSSYRLQYGDEVVLDIPTPVEDKVLPEDIPLDVIYEDPHMLVVNKARGMVVHPADGAPNGTLVNALLWHTKDLSGIGGVKRPGIVHRLDRGTSGLIVVAKKDASHQHLSWLFQSRSIYKKYLALVVGDIPAAEGTIDIPISRHFNDRKKMRVDYLGDKNAITRYTVLERISGHTYLAVRIVTGRTHQIRVHMAHLGYPVFGDEKYGRGSSEINGFTLHSHILGLTHPVTKRDMIFQAPPPSDMERVLNRLRSGCGSK